MAALFQSFDDPADAAAGRPRVAALRAELARRGLDGFVVPHADRYQNEYLPPSDERLAWISGFTGSAGSAIVLADRAALFVDGRYTLEAGEQGGAAARGRPSTPHPIDAVWSDRPAEPLGAVVLHAQTFAGEPAGQKLERIRAELARLKAEALVVCDPHAACWTFSI